MAAYQLTDTDVVIRTADEVRIPNDPANRDREEYDKWFADGGVPDPYVPPEPPPPPPPTVVAWSDEYSSSTAPADLRAGPSAKIAWNTPGQADATEVHVSKLNGKNSDYSAVLSSALQPGRILRIEARADAEGMFTSHRITAVTKQGSAFVIEVTPLDSANAPFANNAQLNLGVFA